VRHGGIAVVLCFGARALLACEATPDLAYQVGDATDAPDATAGKEASTEPEASVGDDGGGDELGRPDAEPDVAAIDARDTDACAPFDAEAGVPYGCCPNAGVICIAQSCAHCGDCANAKCAPTQLCCPTYKGASSNYDSTQCKEQIADCNWR
jgi:hypothetical protein